MIFGPIKKMLFSVKLCNAMFTNLDDLCEPYKMCFDTELDDWYGD